MNFRVKVYKKNTEGLSQTHSCALGVCQEYYKQINTSHINEPQDTNKMCDIWTFPRCFNIWEMYVFVVSHKISLTEPMAKT